MIFVWDGSAIALQASATQAVSLPWREAPKVDVTLVDDKVA